VQCPHVPEIGYGEWSETLHRRILEQRTPIAGSLELTFRCNLRCVHCYAEFGHGGIAGREELTADEIDSILAEAADEGCLWLLLTGGEPLVRSDFQDVYTRAKRRGYLLTLFTNGTLLTPEVADLLAEWRPFSIEVTLYGSTQETYERITGVPGSYERCLRGIELLLDRELPLQLKTIVLTSNRHELGDMRRYAKGLGLSLRYDLVVNTGLDGAKEPLAYRLPVDEIVALERADQVRADAWRDSFATRIGQRRGDDELYACGAGREGFHVDPYGFLSMCLMSRESCYDLRRGSFREGWRSFLPEVRDRRCSADYECRDCDLRSLCGHCPGWGLLQHGDPEAKVEFECRLAHARAEAFMPELTPGAV
jgi:radical SAM protein with 4Fe4S-binding SPASM domain